MPELRHLRYFIAVAEELNFSRAAKRLHMAQPPLSSAIRQLEHELGTDLFTRTTRKVTLTAAGDAFLDGARRTLAEADRAVVTARRTGAGELGQLRLAFSWSAGFETLPALGQAFRVRHPDVGLLTQEMWNVSMITALRTGAVDAAISLCPERGREVAHEVIRTEPVVAVLSATHPLAGERAIPLPALGEEAFVLFPREVAPRLHDAIVDLCRDAGFEPRLRSESFHTIWALGVLNDVAVVALAPRSIASALPEGLVAVALSEPAQRLETQLLWRRDGAPPMVDALLAVARAVYPPAAAGTVPLP